MSSLEAIGQPYLFKLRQSSGVKKLVQRQWTRRDWASVGQGWDACEDLLRLTGWSERRRVIVMRRARKLDLIVEAKRGGRGKGKVRSQAELFFIDQNEPVKSWEYAVLVCNAHYELQSIWQLHRDPCRLRERLRRDQEPGPRRGPFVALWLGRLQHT